MTLRMECLLIFAVVCGTVIVGTVIIGIVSERIARKRREREYYKHLERENKKLRRTVDFCRLQREIQL